MAARLLCFLALLACSLMKPCAAVSAYPTTTVASVYSDIPTDSPLSLTMVTLEVPEAWAA